MNTKTMAERREDNVLLLNSFHMRGNTYPKRLGMPIAMHARRHYNHYRNRAPTRQICLEKGTAFIEIIHLAIYLDTTGHLEYNYTPDVHSWKTVERISLIRIILFVFPRLK